MKLSIITINRNNAEGLERTLNSVLTQTYGEFEYIIVDGASTDSSVDVIKEYVRKVERGESRVKSVVWVSEPDGGIYNAMNKGIRKAKGEYTLMLNSGDYLLDEHVIEQILPELDGTDIVQGNVISTIDGKNVVKRGYGKSDISFIDAMSGQFLHQASFCRRVLFDKYGYFDESYRINGDTVFYAKCLGFGNASFKYVAQNIAYFDMTGISANPDKKWETIRREEDERYSHMFTERMWRMQFVEAKKIKLYDKLHAHKWSWVMTMLVAHLVNLFHKD